MGEETKIINLKSKISHGFSILMIRELLLKGVAFVGQVILARILAPSDFGFYVIIVFIINLCTLFSDIGLSSALIQQKDTPTQNDLTTVFTSKIVLSVIIMLLLFIFSPLTMHIFPGFTTTHVLMLRVISIVLFLSAFRSIPIALLERDINYHVISIIDVIGVSLYYIMVVVCSYAGLHVWSFIIGTIVKEFVEVIAAYKYKPWKIQFVVSFEQLKRLTRFGLFVQGNGVVTFLSMAVTPLLAGTKSGPYAVGLLDFANNVAAIPETITNSFGRVAFAGFAKMQEEKKALKYTIERSIALLTIITLLFTVLLFGFSYQAITIFYTAKWLPAVPALYWFGASTVIIAVVIAIGQGILVLGRSKDLFAIALITNIVGWILSYIFLAYVGFIGIAIGSFVSIMLLFCLYLISAKKNGILGNLIGILLPKYVAAFITFMCVVSLNDLLPINITLFFIKIGLTVSIYILLMCLFSKRDTLALIIIALTLLHLDNIKAKVETYV